MRIRILLGILLFLNLMLVSGCTTIGLSNPVKLEKMDLGEPENMSVCVLKERNVSQENADQIIKELQKEFTQFGIMIDVPWIKTWDRPGFFYDQILADIIMVPLQSPCDRILALVGRHEGDFLWGLLLPEVLGAVEGWAYTKGFSVADVGSFNQILGLATPNSIAVHESYHFFGCEHDLVMDTCYDRIKDLKDTANKERKAGNDFFPAVTNEGKILKTRTEVNNELYQIFSKYIKTVL